MTILVIGRTGQLACSLADVAAQSPDLAMTFTARPEVDLAIPGAAAAHIATVRPGLVINAAAYTQVDRAESEGDLVFRINAEAASEIAKAAADVGAGIIQVSTDYVFDGAASEPYGESAPTRPINVYGASKLAGEEAVRGANPNHWIVRTSWLVSPYSLNFVKTMLRLADDRDELGVVADQVGRPTVVADLAEALVAIVHGKEAAEPGTYHLAGSGDPASWADLAEHIFAVRRAATGTAPAVRRIATSDYPTPAPRPLYSALDCSKAQSSLGISLPAWRDSVGALVHNLVAAKS